MDFQEGGGCEKWLRLVLQSSLGLIIYTLLKLMSLVLVRPTLGEATQHSRCPETLEKEIALLKWPFFKFILLFNLTIAYSVTYMECLLISPPSSQHQHLPAVQLGLLPCQINCLLLYLIPWCHLHLSKQISGQIN